MDEVGLCAEWDITYWTRGTIHDNAGWDHNDEPSQEPYVCSEEARRMVEKANELDLLYQPPPRPKKRSSTYGSYLARKRIAARKKKGPAPTKKHKKKKAPPIPAAFTSKKKPPAAPEVTDVVAKKPPPPVARKTRTKKPQLSKVNKKPGMSRKNEAGYPMKQCEYEYAESCFVYRPPGYADGLDRPCHCAECHLKPCITSKHYNEAVEWVALCNILDVNNKDNAEHEADIVRFMEKHRCKTLNISYDADRQPPPCIVAFAKHIVNFDPEGESEDDDDDSILDDFPYSLLRDRQPGDPPTKVLLEMYHNKQEPPRPGMWKRFNYSFFDRDKKKEEPTKEQPPSLQLRQTEKDEDTEEENFDHFQPNLSEEEYNRGMEEYSRQQQKISVDLWALREGHPGGPTLLEDYNRRQQEIEEENTRLTMEDVKKARELEDAEEAAEEDEKEFEFFW